METAVSWGCSVAAGGVVFGHNYSMHQGHQCSLRVLSIVISGVNRLTSMNRGTKLVMCGKNKYNSGYKQRHTHTTSSRMFYHMTDTVCE